MNKANKIDPLSIKCFLWGFFGGVLGFIGIIPSIYFGHKLLFQYKKKPENFIPADKRMVIGGLIFAYAQFIVWCRISYHLITLFID